MVCMAGEYCGRHDTSYYLCNWNHYAIGSMIKVRLPGTVHKSGTDVFFDEIMLNLQIQAPRRSSIDGIAHKG